MIRERYFMTSGRPRRHILFLDIEELNLDGESICLCWNLDFEIDLDANPKIIDLLTEAITNTKNRQEREPIIAEVWELIKCIPDIEMQYLPTFEIDEKGEFSESLRVFFKNIEENITKNSAHFIKVNEAYCELQNTLVFRLASVEIRKKFWQWIKDGTIVEVDPNAFLQELTPAVAKVYIEHYTKKNKFYTMSFDFPLVGWLDCWFILCDYNIPFFFFKKSPLLNLFNVL